jgi:hypothetical protein
MFTNKRFEKQQNDDECLEKQQNDDECLEKQQNNNKQLL